MSTSETSRKSTPSSNSKRHCTAFYPYLTLPSAFKNIGGKGGKPEREEKPDPPSSIPIKIMGGGKSKHKAKEFYTNK